MTNEIKLEVTCVHCLGVGEKQLYPIINRQDLEAKQNICFYIVVRIVDIIKGFRMNVCIMMRN